VHCCYQTWNVFRMLMNALNGLSETTAAFFVQAAVAFGIGFRGALGGMCFLPLDPWQRLFLAITSLFLVTSSVVEFATQLRASAAMTRSPRLHGGANDRTASSQCEPSASEPQVSHGRFRQYVWHEPPPPPNM
jgi:hypothetical protein